MSVAPQCGFAHPRHQFFESRVSRKIAAQHQSIDEESDQILDLEPVSAGNRHTKRNVILATDR